MKVLAGRHQLLKRAPIKVPIFIKVVKHVWLLGYLTILTELIDSNFFEKGVRVIGFFKDKVDDDTPRVLLLKLKKAAYLLDQYLMVYTNNKLVRLCLKFNHLSHFGASFLLLSFDLRVHITCQRLVFLLEEVDLKFQ